jgi:hypothetical protein
MTGVESKGPRRDLSDLRGEVPRFVPGPSRGLVTFSVISRGSWSEGNTQESSRVDAVRGSTLTAQDPSLRPVDSTPVTGLPALKPR